MEVFFFLFVFKAFLKDFPLYSPILLDLWFKYLKIRRKESFMYLSGQLFFKTPNETLKFQGKYISHRSADVNFKSFPFVVYHEATP